MENQNTRESWFSRIVNPIKKHKVSSQKPAEENFYFNDSPFTKDDAQDYVAWNLRVAAAWSWRLLIVGLVVVVVLYGLLQIKIVIVPIFVSLLLTVTLFPMFNFLEKKLHFPRVLACTVSLIFGIILIFGMIYIASSQIVYGMGDLVTQANKGLNQAILWITESLKQYLHVNDTQVQSYLHNFNNEINSYITGLIGTAYSSAISITSSVATFLAGTLLSLFAVFFFLKDGRQIWYWTVRLFPSSARVPVHEAAIRGWITLSSYVRAQIIIAAVDALSIGFGAYLIGVPLAIPLTVLVFLGSFIPIVGALFSGSIAVLVAFVNNGITSAIIMFVIILIVQQVEGNLLQPLIMSSSVSLHPLAVLISVTAATYLMGIIGALFVIPVIAFVNTTVLYLHGYDKFPELETKIDRPGGPPGFIEMSMHASLREEPNTLKQTIIDQINERENAAPAFHEGNLSQENTEDENETSIPPIR
ncbi:AI-2E family transporter [Actinomyces sp. zg-332]|uniref:AI-2E family transporter n=1 Tax=Actinomyces sp. zg-332 TaxID=2708340 RepID=UPI001421001C|nr:AI-2E family transporter [Actinomyces sp. zg-332]QPK94210.1 AI-2E family transporter [Actinomyces sp. zg-332]